MRQPTISQAKQQDVTALLPSDLLIHIIGFVEEQHDLMKLCLTASSVLPIAQRALYRFVKLREPVRIIRFCHIVLQKPELAPFVRSLEILFFHNYGGWRRVLAPGYTRLVFRALRTLTRLEHLSFNNAARPLDWASDNLIGCNFQLKKLEVVAVGRLDLSFLNRQPMLEDLTIFLYGASHEGIMDCYHTLKILPPSVLAKVHTLTTSWRISLALVPYRPVERLTLCEDLDLPNLENGFSTLALSATPLRYLSLELPSISAEVIQWISTYLRDLVELVICLQKYDGVTVVAVLNSQDSVIAFRNFRRLDQLDIFVEGWQTLEEDDHLPAIERIGNSCSTLSRIRFAGAYVRDPHNIKAAVRFERHDGGSWLRKADFIYDTLPQFSYHEAGS